jgi:3-hydroxyacyl-CoA dehydrogenase, NAD binding domain
MATKPRPTLYHRILRHVYFNVNLAALLTVVCDCQHTRCRYELPQRKALEYEAKRFSEMAATPQSAALIGLFDGSTALKKSPFGAPARRVEMVAVLGAGLMGAGIAQVTAEKGYKVLLKDRDSARYSFPIVHVCAHTLYAIESSLQYTYNA